MPADPLVIPDGYGNVTMKWSFEGKSGPCSTTLGVRRTGPATPQEVVDAIYDDLTIPDGICDPDNMQEEWTFLGVEGIFMVDDVLTGAAAAGAPVPGTKTTQHIPPLNTSLLVRKRSTLIGRRYRGRMYLPVLSIDEGVISPLGIISSAPFNAYDVIVHETTDNWLASINFTPVILHHDETPPTDISSFSLQPTVVTQRRRLRT